MPSRMLTAAVVAVLVTAGIAAYFFISFSQSSSSSALSISSYKVIPGADAPTLKLKFSHNLKKFATVLLKDSDYNTVGRWEPHPYPAEEVDISNINPPNLIGTYYVVVKYGDEDVLNTSLIFNIPVLNVTSIYIEKATKDTDVFLEYINLTIIVDGPAPYYYNHFYWKLGTTRGVEEVSVNYFDTGMPRTLHINVGRHFNAGTYTLTVYFDYSGSSSEVAEKEITI